MVIRKAKKVAKYRGSRTHGGGESHRRRGSGSRGGVGQAGSGKRGDTKKPSYQKIKRFYGKHGFKVVNNLGKTFINLSYIERHVDYFMKNNFVTEEKGVYTIDGKQIGLDRLLGSGRITKKFSVKNVDLTPKLKEKIINAGGSIEE